MSKYDPLRDRLLGVPAGTQEVVLTFGEIDDLLDSPLPPSAYRHEPWWKDESPGTRHVQAHA